MIYCRISYTYTSYTGHFLFNTMSSFFGHAQAPIHVSKPASRNRIGSALHKEGEKWMGKSIAKLMKQDDDASRSGLRIVCENCGKYGDDYNFQLCSACKHKFDRRIYYCSK